MVDKDDRRFGFADASRQLAERLRHEAGLKAHLGVAHLPLQLGLGHEGRDGIDDQDVQGAAANEGFGDFEGLLAAVGLRDQQVVGIDADLAGVGHIEGVLGVDEGRQSVLFLRLGHDVQGKGRFSARFGAENLDHPSPGNAAHAECGIEPDGARRDYGDVGDLVAAAQPHDGALAKLAFDLGNGQIHRLCPIHIRCHFDLPDFSILIPETENRPIRCRWPPAASDRS